MARSPEDDGSAVTTEVPGAPRTDAEAPGTVQAAAEVAGAEHAPGTDAEPDDRDPVGRGSAADEEIVRRLRSVQGHVRGVERMVSEGSYCIDVMNQIFAVQKALGKVSDLVLDRHLHTCATRAIQGEDPEERERVIGEILDVFHASRPR